MRHWSVLALALVAGVSFANEQKPVVFPAEARVEVDAEGKLVKVEAAGDLPAAIRTFVEQQVKTWQFTPKPREGLTGNVSTWLTLGACAVPAEGGGYTMGLAFHSNGPRIAGGGKWPLSEELMTAVARHQASGMVDVVFVVGADGKATVESIEGSDARTRRAVSPALRNWLGALRFEPEAIGGQPVATRQSVPVEFRSGVGSRPGDDMRQSPQCKQAVAAGQSVAPNGIGAVAIDSVVNIVPSI